MSGFLLDTNIALLALAAPEELSAASRAVIRRGPNILSVVSYWEVILKAAKGKLEVGDPRVWWETALSDLAATALPFRAAHVARAGYRRVLTLVTIDRGFALRPPACSRVARLLG